MYSIKKEETRYTKSDDEDVFFCSKDQSITTPQPSLPSNQSLLPSHGRYTTDPLHLYEHICDLNIGPPPNKMRYPTQYHPSTPQKSVRFCPK